MYSLRGREIGAYRCSAILVREGGRRHLYDQLTNSKNQ